MNRNKWMALLLAGAMTSMTLGCISASAEETTIVMNEAAAVEQTGEDISDVVDAAVEDGAAIVDSAEDAISALRAETSEDVSVTVDEEGTVATETDETTDEVITTTVLAEENLVQTGTVTVEVEVTTELTTDEAIITTELSGDEGEGEAPLNYYDDVVLCLDVSSSMSGEPLEAMQEAAMMICAEFLQNDPNTVISIVTFGTDVNTLAYSSDYATLADYIANLKASGNTNMYEGLEAVKVILDGSNGESKSVIIMADGKPNNGSSSYSTDYTPSGYSFDSYQKAALEFDTEELKTSATVYTIGFYHNGNSTADNEQFIIELASNPANSHVIYSIDDLNDVFLDIFGQITGVDTTDGKITAEGTSDSSDTGSSPNTGDYGSTIAISIMALGVACVFAARVRQKKEDR